MYRVACVLTLAAALTAGSTARGSGPVGGYLIVDRVVVGPRRRPDNDPDLGELLLWPKGTGGQAVWPARARLPVLQGPSGAEALCRKEWSDLEEGGGDGAGHRLRSNHEVTFGEVRKANKKPDAPVNYPFGNGLVRCDGDTDHARSATCSPCPRRRRPRRATSCRPARSPWLAATSPTRSTPRRSTSSS